ncbi:lasso peptide biosynthesis B2 protein [Sphingomonas sp. CJ20]
MFWRILPHASACLCGGRVTILDLRQDRYFQLPRAASADAASWLERGYNSSPPPSFQAMLQRAGIYRDGDRAPTNGLRDSVSLPDTLATPKALAPRTVIPTAAQVLSSWASLKTLSFRTILERRQSRAPLSLPIDPEPALEIAAGFDRARALVPLARNCLLDSLALDSMLATYGIGAYLVFGVALHPFEAHCWLQTRHAILNDSYDHVSRFTPILAQ